jgi:hypothetical protein
MSDEKRCAECGALYDPDDQRDWGYGFDFVNDRRWYTCPDCAEGSKLN